LSKYVEARVEAINALVNKNYEIPDICWEWARIFHLSQLSQYAKQQQGYARETAGTSVEQLFSRETVERWVTTACEDLAMVLGLGLLYPSMPGLPEQLRLDVWKHRVKGATLTSWPVVSPVMLPNGMFPLYLEAPTGCATRCRNWTHWLHMPPHHYRQFADCFLDLVPR
jgi:hypothetical protein